MNHLVFSFCLCYHYLEFPEAVDRASDKCIGERDRNRERQASDEERIWETVDMCVAEETQEEK